MQQRRGTSAQWSLASPAAILAAGEIGFEQDTGRFKIGDGITPWAQLSYFANISEINQIVADLVDLAPETLDTLKELADAINNDPDFFNTVREDIDQALLDSKEYTDDSVQNLKDTNQTIIAGGSSGQVIQKLSEDDYDIAWIDPRSRVENLDDVSLGSLENKDVLVYDSENEIWVNSINFGKFIVQNTAPQNPQNGDSWLNPNLGKGYIYSTEEGDWIELGASFAGVATLNSLDDVVVDSPTKGQILVYNGITWENNNDLEVLFWTYA